VYKCAVSDVRVSTFIIVSEFTSDNVVSQRGLRAEFTSDNVVNQRGLRAELASDNVEAVELAQLAKEKAYVPLHKL
jgi:hypothetical protein